jgi:hypothetical protein
MVNDWLMHFIIIIFNYIIKCDQIHILWFENFLFYNKYHIGKKIKYPKDYLFVFQIYFTVVFYWVIMVS